MQLKINYDDDVIFEWIPYNQFEEIEEMGKDNKSAIWKDGPLYYSHNKNIYVIKKSMKVVLKYLYDLQNIIIEV